MTTTTVPEDLLDLLERPLFASLGTVRPDGSVREPERFDWDGEHLRFTHTTQRAKYRNLQANPSMSLLVIDPDDPLRFVEVRGELVAAEPDPTGSFYVHLGQRYGDPDTSAPPDSADRVILVMDVRKVQRK